MVYKITEEMIQQVLTSIDSNITLRQAKEISAFLRSNPVEQKPEVTQEPEEVQE